VTDVQDDCACQRMRMSERECCSCSE
jgi:hypothetical protein